MTPNKDLVVVTTYTHTKVNEDGTLQNDAGVVHAEGCIQISHPKGGCGMDGCNCSPGHWITATLPRTKGGIVRGVTFTFSSRTELLRYLNLFGKTR